MLIRLLKLFLGLSFVAILTLSFAQQISGYFYLKPLKGDVIISPKPKFALKKWFTGEFQSDFDRYVNENIGFRSLLIRIRNQISFNFFNRARANGVIIGKDNYLYEINYIRAFNGEDYLGRVALKEKVLQIKKLQNILLAHDKRFLICLAPGKGSFYPEYFPEKYAGATPGDSVNYLQYINLFKENNVNFIDFNGWFKNMKDTSTCSLYPKYGIHWSYHGMLLSADSIIGYIESKINKDIPELHVMSNEISSSLKYTDYDIAEGMNLLFPLSSYPMCYPKVKWESDSAKYKPKTVVISDSFYWSMFNAGIATNCFSLGGFWYYNKQIYPDSYKTPTMVVDVDIKKRIDDAEIVIIMSTESNLPDLGWGFVQNAIKVYN